MATRVYGYVRCSVCDRLVADHEQEEARECGQVLERDQRKPGWRRNSMPHSGLPSDTPDNAPHRQESRVQTLASREPG